MPSARKPPKQVLFRWRISLIKKKVQDLGSVEAESESAAIDEAVRVYGIDEASRFRLAARRVS